MHDDHSTIDCCICLLFSLSITVQSSQLSDAFQTTWAKFTRSTKEAAAQAWEALADGEGSAPTQLQRAAQYIVDKGVVVEGSAALYFNGRLQRRHGDWQTSLIVPAMYEMQYLQVRLCMLACTRLHTTTY